jgi:hypothetical protein
MTKTDEIPGNIRAAMKKLGDQRRNMAADLDVRDAREQYRRAHHRLEQAEAALAELEAPYRDDMEETKQYLMVNALEVEASFEHAGVDVNYRKGYERETWNTKQMRKLIAENPEIGNLTEPAHKVSAVPPKVTIPE